jgi:1-acyl-sn-glycerol-3-phosphate acyltransferase
MRTLLAPLRLLALLLHIIIGLAIAATLFPAFSQARRNRTIRRWSMLLVRICGTRVRVTGRPVAAQIADSGIASDSSSDGRKAAGRLLLANHISWFDVFAINAVLPSRFIAKSEIGRWPLLGPLVSRAGTLYIERGRRHAVAAMNHQVAARLGAGETVAVFPEGTTTDGDTLLPFHSNLIAPALEAGAPIWPLALRYREGGVPSRAAAFIGEMGLVTSLWNIVTARRLEMELCFAEPIEVHSGENRHALAEAARQAIAAQLGLTVVPHQRFKTNGAAGQDADNPGSAADAALDSASERR